MDIFDFQKKKQRQEKIAMITCYDYPSACIVSESLIDTVLVGDSVAMAVHGHPTTLAATLEMMVLHTAAVARGLKKQFLVCDLPFLEQRLPRARRLDAVRKLLQAGAQALKIEGGDEENCKIIAQLVQAGIPVMGHIGLTPQFVHQFGGYKVQGRTEEAAKNLEKQALTLENAGCFALVLECIPQNLAAQITAGLTIPTIGIGAGPHTDGQILVWHDLLGLQTAFKPKFLKQFAHSKTLFLEALDAYASEVQKVSFPTPEYSYD